jgi:hypothetical protein
MNLGENIETDDSGLITGLSTGRLIAKFSHVEEAKTFVEMVNNHAPIDSGIAELDSLCRKYNSGQLNISQLVCSVWNRGLFVGGQDQELLKVNRLITTDECPWLREDIREGVYVHKYKGHTYGCLSKESVAVTLQKNILPFLELPKDALSEGQFNPPRRV